MLQQRVHIVEVAINSYREHPFHEVDLQFLSDHSGVAKDVIQRHFPHWDGLVVAVVDRWTNRRTAPLLPLADQFGTVRFLRAMVQSNVEDSSLMRFLTATLNIAATPGHPMAPDLHARWREFHLLIQRCLTRDIGLGREPETMTPARGAEQLIAMYEGLQVQYMVRPTMDLLDAYDRGVTRLRDGWSRAYSRPVWTIDDSR